MSRLFSCESSIPPGYRFYPTKEEILRCYLRPAINGEPLSAPVFIQCEIYGENKEPWKIFNKDSKDTFWVFTKLKKKSKCRIDRTAGRGCWLGRSIKEVKDENGEVLGFHKYFTFSCKKDNNVNNGHWIMHEFSLKDEGFNGSVICEIRNKDVAVGFGHQGDEVAEPKKIKKRKALEVDAQGMSVSVPKKKKVSADDDQCSLNEKEISSDIEANSSSILTIDRLNIGELLGHQETDQDSNRVRNLNGISCPNFNDDDFPEDFDDLLNVLDLLETISSDEQITLQNSCLLTSDFDLVVNDEETLNPAVKNVRANSNLKQATCCQKNSRYIEDQENFGPNFMLLQTMTSSASSVQRKPDFIDDSLFVGLEELQGEFQLTTSLK